MQTPLRLPVSYLCHDSAIISILDQRVDSTVAMEIKGKPFFAKYYTWDFVGKIWWDANNEHWCIEIWKDHEYECTYMAATLEDLLQEITGKHAENI